MPKGKGKGEGSGESAGTTNITSIILGAITIVLALISKIVPLRGDPKMSSGLIRGNLNQAWHGNPELSGAYAPKCVETIDPLPLVGNEIVRYSSESRREQMRPGYSDGHYCSLPDRRRIGSQLDPIPWWRTNAQTVPVDHAGRIGDIRRAHGLDGDKGQDVHRQGYCARSHHGRHRGNYAAYSHGRLRHGLRQHERVELYRPNVIPRPGAADLHCGPDVRKWTSGQAALGGGIA